MKRHFIYSKSNPAIRLEVSAPEFGLSWFNMWMGQSRLFMNSSGSRFIAQQNDPLKGEQRRALPRNWLSLIAIQPELEDWL